MSFSPPSRCHSPPHPSPPPSHRRAAVSKSALSMAEHILSLKTQKALRPSFDWATAESRHVVSAPRPLMGSLGEIRRSPLPLPIMIPRTRSHRNTRPPPTPSSPSPPSTSFMARSLFLDLLWATEKKTRVSVPHKLKCLVCVFFRHCHRRAALAESEFKTSFSPQRKESERTFGSNWMKMCVFHPKKQTLFNERPAFA